MPAITLVPKNEANGKTYYELIVLWCKGASQHNSKKEAEKHQFYFHGLEDYWTINKHPAPEVGSWYTVGLSVKPADKGAYRDIVSIEPADAPSGSQEPDAMEDHFEEQGDQRDGRQTREPVKPPKEPIQERIEIGMAFNGAYTLIASQGCQGEMVAEIRMLRDRLLHEVILIPPAPAHYCYEHEAARSSIKGETWVHRVSETVFCHEAGLFSALGVPVDAQGKAVTEEATDDLPF